MNIAWDDRSVDEVCVQVTSGGTPSRRVAKYFGGSIPWVKTQELSDGWVYDTHEHITEAGLDNSSAKLLPANSVLMAMYGATVGKLAILSREMTCNQAACAMIVDPRLADFRFLYYLLFHDRPRIVDLANGAAQQNLNAGTIRALRYRFPPVEDQRAIAATLSALDDKLESNRRAISTAGWLLDATSEKWAAIVPSVGLGELVAAQRSTITPARLGDQMVDHFSLPAFDKNVWPDRVLAGSIMSNKLIVEGPSILVSRLNPRFNRTWWAVPAEVPAVASTEFSCLVTKDRTELAGVWLAVRDAAFRTELVHRVTGTSGSHQRIRPDDMLSIHVPDIREISEHAKRDALALLDLIHVRRRENVKLSVLRDTLLPELLSGRIRVPDTARLWETVA